MNDVAWHPKALSDRQAVLADIAQQAPALALEWDQDLEGKLNQAATNPAGVPAGRVPGTQELFLLPHYVLVLQRPTDLHPLTVLRLLHTSKPWPAIEGH